MPPSELGEGSGLPGMAARADRVTRLFVAAVGVGLVAVIARVAQLEIRPEQRLTRYIGEHTLERPIPGTRGMLRDRRGRPVAGSRLGYRVVIDPVALKPDEVHQTISALADATGLDADVIGERIISRLDENDRRRAALQLVEEEPKPPTPEALWQTIRERFAMGEDDAVVTPGPFVALYEGDGGDGDADGLKPLIRYLPLRAVIDHEQADRVRAMRLSGVIVEPSFVRERLGPVALAPVIGKVSAGDRGLTGLEQRLDDRLTGEPGRVRFVRDAGGRPLWIERGEVVPAYQGEDLRVSFDLELQRTLDEALAWGVQRADAAGGRAVAIDPMTGEVLAMSDLIVDRDDLEEMPWVMPGTPREMRARIPEDPRDRPRYRVLEADPRRGDDWALTRVRNVVDAFEPGSIFKPFAWSVASSAGVLPSEEVLHFTGRTHRTSYGRSIQDVFPKGELTWDEALVNSSNRAMAVAAERLTPAQMRGGLLAFGFGSTTGVGVVGESPGLITGAKGWDKYTQVSVSFGQEIAVTPVQMARAFSAFARNGELAGSIPQLTLLAAEADGVPTAIVRRAIEPDAALHTRSVMHTIGQNLDRKLKVVAPELAPPRYTMFGKSGTAQIPCSPPRVTLEDGTEVRMLRPINAGGYHARQYICSFVAGAPLAEPRIVVLVTIEDPGPARVRRAEFYGSDVAGPVARRFIERALPYMGVRPDLATAPERAEAGLPLGMGVLLDPAG